MELTDKKTDHVYRGLGIFEDCGDIGNEYIFFAPVNDVPVTTKKGRKQRSQWQKITHAAPWSV